MVGEGAGRPSVEEGKGRPHLDTARHPARVTQFPSSSPQQVDDHPPFTEEKPDTQGREITCSRSCIREKAPSCREVPLLPNTQQNCFWETAREGAGLAPQNGVPIR